MCAIVFKLFSKVRILDVQGDGLAVLTSEVERLGNSVLTADALLNQAFVFCLCLFLTLCPAAAFQMPPKGMNWDQNPGSCLLLLVFRGLYILKPQLATGLVSLKEQVMKAAFFSLFPCHLTEKSMTPPQTDSSVWVIYSNEKNINKTEKQRLTSPTCSLWGAN